MANPYAPPAAVESPVALDIRGYRDTRTLSVAVRALLGANIAVSVLTIVFSFGQLDLFERIERGAFTIAEAEASDAQAAAITSLFLLTFLANAIVWIIWQERTSHNARALGTEFMQFGPKAWGWFFCPIINLYRPLAVVRELWQVNGRDSSEEPGFFGVWWVTWIIGSILGNVATNMVTEDADIDQLVLSVEFSIASEVIMIVSAIFAVKVVAEVHRRERTRAEAQVKRSGR